VVTYACETWVLKENIKGDESSSTTIILSKWKRPQYSLNKNLDCSGEEKISWPLWTEQWFQGW
jgi:hypothetical protein